MQIREQSVRERGTIVKFIPDRGFGFIEREACADVWFHITEVEPGEVIQPGMLAEFTVSTDERGRLRAVGVELLAGHAR